MMPTCATTCTALALEGIQPQTWLIIGIVIILGTLFIRRSRTKLGRPGADTRATAQARLHNKRLTSQAHDDISELMLRLEQLSREICGQIDTRFAKLEHVIREADAKLAALRNAERHPALPAASPIEPAAPPDPKHAEVCRRAGEGQLVLEIAREMEMPIGEVELILSLQRSRQAAPSLATPPPTTDEPEDVGPPKGLRLDERA